MRLLAPWAGRCALRFTYEQQTAGCCPVCTEFGAPISALLSTTQCCSACEQPAA